MELLCGFPENPDVSLDSQGLGHVGCITDNFPEFRKTVVCFWFVFKDSPFPPGLIQVTHKEET